MKTKIIIPILTLCLGFFPMLIMSIYSDGFWISSPYDYPLILIPAILIGDSILLPILNFRIFNSIKLIRSNLPRNFIFSTIFGSFILSILLNSYTHYLWSHGDSTGFMEPEYGKLSLAGWWHYGFSIIQMSFIFIFIVYWIITVRSQSRSVFRYFENTLYVFIFFIIVNISGTFVNRELITQKTFTIDLSLPSLLNTFSPFLLSIIFLFYMRKKVRSENKLYYSK